MDAATLLALPHDLAITTIEPTDEVLTLHLMSTRRCACCPVCAEPAMRIHSTYLRTVADLPCGAKRVQLRLHVHKYFCDNAECRRKIFVERILPFIAPWARRTERFNRSLQSIGLATCGKLGARLAWRLGMPASWMTILRRILAMPSSADDFVPHLGIDDFAFQRRRRYGSILVNLDAHRICDLLPDRKTETAAHWMLAHPEIDVVSRDRGEDFAAAARQGAPQAMQTADRFHLMKNLVEAIEPIVARSWKTLRQEACALPLPPPLEPDPALPEPDVLEPVLEWRPFSDKQEYAPIHEAHLAAKQEQFEQVMRWYEGQIPISTIAHSLGLSKRTIQRWIATRTCPLSQPRRKRRSEFDQYAAWAAWQWQHGCHDTMKLWQEIQKRGYTGSWRTVYRYVRTIRQGNESVTCTAPPPVVEPIPCDPDRLESCTFHDAVWLFVRDPHDLDDEEQAQLHTLCQLSAKLEALYALVQSFGEMVRRRQGQRLETWQSEVDASDFPELKRFAKGLDRDKEAVVAGLTERYSNGMVEGFVNKVKMIKRVMFGKASFPLLRQRVLHAL